MAVSKKQINVFLGFPSICCFISSLCFSFICHFIFSLCEQLVRLLPNSCWIFVSSIWTSGNFSTSHQMILERHYNIMEHVSSLSSILELIEFSSYLNFLEVDLWNVEDIFFYQLNFLVFQKLLLEFGFKTKLKERKL